MPRVKPSKAQPNFMARAHELRDDQKAELLRLLGYDKIDPLAESLSHQLPGMKVAKTAPGAPLLLVRDSSGSIPPTTNVWKAILDVETWLGFFVHGAHHLDSIPRPADYVAALAPIRQEAFNLYNALSSLSGYYRDQFPLKGTDIHDIEAGIATLIDVSGAILRDFEKRPSKGARRNTALTEVVRRLRRIFHNYYRGPRTARTRRGAFQSLADWEKRELEFVGAALRFARIIPEGYSALPRLFRDPRCALPEDRAETIGRISKKVEKTRARKQKRNMA